MAMTRAPLAPMARITTIPLRNSASSTAGVTSPSPPASPPRSPQPSPAGIAPQIPAALTTWEAVDLSPALREAIKAASPHAQLIAQRVIDLIRAKYPLDEELYFARIAVGALQNSYTLLPGEAEALAQYQTDVEAAREWGRTERAKIGL